MKLYYLNGPKSGEAVDLSPPLVTLGRETDNDLSLLVGGISRYHAKLEYTENAWTIKDLGSTNGTKVNGELISTALVLKGGETLSLGDQSFKIEQSDNEKAVSAKAVMPTEMFAVDNFLTAQAGDSTIPEINIKPLDIAPVAEAAPTAPIPSAAVNPAPAAAPAPVMFTPTVEKQSSPEVPIDPTPSQAGAGIFSATSIMSDPVPESKTEDVQKSKDDSPFGKGNFFSSNSDDTSGENKKKNKFLINALFYIGVIFLAIIMVMVFLKSEEKNSGSNTAFVAPKKVPPFLLAYEKQVTTKDNIFRYEMRIEDKNVHITLDDLKYQRHVSLPKELTDDQLETLKYEVRNSQFLELGSVEKGSASGYEDDERKITICIDEKFNMVKVKNNYAPNSFLDAERIVEELSAGELGIKSVTLTPEEMKEEARESFEIAQIKFDNYEAHPMNLTLAIKRYQMAMENLRSFVNKPDYWETARKNKLKAETLLDDKVNALLFNGDKAFRLSEYQKARESTVLILKMVDSTDPRYERARKRIINLDKNTRGLKQK